MSVFSKKVSLTTKDNVTLSALSFASPKMPAKKTVILLPQLNFDKNSFSDLPQMLVKEGFNVVSVDLRGHGESQGKWSTFSDSDFVKMENDLEAAIVYSKKTFPNTKIAVIGSSIGANTAFNFAAKSSQIESVVLLSPGINFRGINIQKSLTDYPKTGKKILVCASKDDEYSTQAAQEIKKANPQAELIILENAGHGTKMFTPKPQLKKQIVEWIEKN